MHGHNSGAGVRALRLLEETTVPGNARALRAAAVEKYQEKKQERKNQKKLLKQAASLMPKNYKVRLAESSRKVKPSNIAYDNDIAR